MTALAISNNEAAAPASDVVVRADGLVRRYGAGTTSVEALSGVSIDVESARMTAIMGPSGSGKSTLMHLLAGLDTPTEGSIVLDGAEITDAVDRHVQEIVEKPSISRPCNGITALEPRNASTSELRSRGTVARR